MKKLKPIWQIDKDNPELEFAVVGATIEVMEQYQKEHTNYDIDMLSPITFKIIRATCEEDFNTDLLISEEDNFIDLLESQTYWVNLKHTL